METKAACVLREQFFGLAHEAQHVIRKRGKTLWGHTVDICRDMVARKSRVPKNRSCWIDLKLEFGSELDPDSVLVAADPEDTSSVLCVS